MRLLRLPAVLERLACKRTTFDVRFRLHSASDPLVPGTNIHRLKGIPITAKAIGYLESEVDTLISALAAMRDVPPLRVVPVLQMQQKALQNQQGAPLPQKRSIASHAKAPRKRGKRRIKRDIVTLDRAALSRPKRR